MYACYACVHACTVVRFWCGSMAGWVRRGMRAAPFSHLPVLSCRYSPLQPTPTGAFEKVRFAIQVYTHRILRGMRGERVGTLRSGACSAGSRPNGAEADEVPGDRHSARTGEVPTTDTVPGQAMR